MKLVVGLGNPGDSYRNSRHNAGCIILDAFAQSQGFSWTSNKKLASEVSVARESGYILLKPQTFMNDSGKAVVKALKFFKLTPADLLVIHDDVDLGALQFKLAHNSSSAGHHGVQDIIDQLGTQDFTRIRVGVGRPVVTSTGAERAVFDVEKYVLQDFSSDQLEVVKKQGIEHLLSSLNL